MESLSMLGLAGQARAPTQAPGHGAITGPPGAAANLPWEAAVARPKGDTAGTASADARAEFAALLQRLTGAAPRPAPDAPAQGNGGTEPASEGASHVDEGEDAEGVPGPRPRKATPPSGEPAVLELAVVPAAMPLDLIQGAASGEPAPEPSGTGAGSETAVTAVAPSATAGPGAAFTPPMAETPPMAGTPPMAEAPPEADASGPTEMPPTAEAQTAPAPAPESPHPPADALAQRGVSGGEAAAATEMAAGSAPATEAINAADGKEIALSAADAAPRTRKPDEPRSARAGAGETPSQDAEPAAEPATHVEGATPARESSSQARARVASDAKGDAESSPDVASEVDGKPTTAQPREAPSAAVRNASASAETTEAEASTRPAPAAAAARAAARHVEVERPAHRPQETLEAPPSNLTVLTGGAHAEVVHWLQGSERVDEGQALQQAQRMLASNLVDDIRRLTFIGQDSAVLQLQPPELGKLNVHLNVQDGELSVEMLVETEAVKAIVESTLDQLRTALSQHGLTTTSVFVGVGGSAHRDSGSWQTRRGRETRADTESPRQAEAAALGQRAQRATAFDSTVDYRI